METDSYHGGPIVRGGWDDPLPKKEKKGKLRTARFTSYSNTSSLRNLPFLTLLVPGSGIYLMAHPTHDQLRKVALAILRQLRACSLLIDPAHTFRQLRHYGSVSKSAFISSRGSGEGWEERTVHL